MICLNRVVNKSIITLSVIFFVSCNITDPLIFETHEVDFINKTGDVIHGEILGLDIAGGKTIAVYDTMLITITNNPEALLQVYDTRTLKPLAMLCQQGHASNEFSDKYIYKSDQFFLRNGDVIIVLRGEGGYVLKEINISASIREGYTIVEKTRNDIPYGCEELVALDNGIDRLFLFNNHNYSIDREDYNPPSFCIKDKEITSDIKVYERLVDFEKKRFSTFWYSGSLCKHPTRNIVVQCIRTMDYIHFFDLDNNVFYSVHQIGSPTFDNIRVLNTTNKDGSINVANYIRFYESIATEDLFFVIYLNGDYRKKNLIQSRGEATELLAFDWEGNYLGGAKLDFGLNDLAYDSNNKILFGIRTDDEKIVTFDLSNFIETLRK